MRRVGGDVRLSKRKHLPDACVVLFRSPNPYTEIESIMEHGRFVGYAGVYINSSLLESLDIPNTLAFSFFQN